MKETDATDRSGWTCSLRTDDRGDDESDLLYWRGRSADERVEAAWALSEELYALRNAFVQK